jgi:KDO2-lipid IV(A) lauroyltransferase
MNEPSGQTPKARLEAPHRRVASAPRFVEKMAVFAYRSAGWLLSRLPARPAWTVIGWFAQASYLAWPSKRRWSNQNFAHVLGTSPDDPAVRRLALRAYANYARYLVELMRLPGMAPEDAAALLDPEGIDEVERIWRASNGVIFIASHVGNNEAIAAGIGARGWPLSGVADDSTFPELFELLRRERARWGARVIPWRNLREVYGVLKRREMLALLVDWGYRADGIPVRLFDAWTTLPAGPATLAGKTGAVILPVVARRLPDGRFHATTEEPITVASTKPAELLRATQAIADALGRVIGAAPEQWYNFKPMWPETAAEMAELEARAERMAGDEAEGTGDAGEPTLAVGAADGSTGA